MKPNKRYTVLIADDHPLITEAYKSALNRVSEKNEEISFEIQVVYDCDGALGVINEMSNKKKNLDIVFLDMKLPPSNDGKILCGEDLGLKINSLMSATKIIVATTFDDNYRIHSIFKSINPDGFLIKNDITPEDLVAAIESIVLDPPYYSKTVIKLLRKQVSNDFLLDNIDRRLLYELSKGTKMKSLPDILPLSIAGIEKRKRNLKEIFNVKGTDDRELLYMAKEKGFI